MRQLKQIYKADKNNGHGSYIIFEIIIIIPADVICLKVN